MLAEAMLATAPSARNIFIIMLLPGTGSGCRHGDRIDEIWRVTETLRRHTTVFAIVQDDALAERAGDLVRHGFIPNREGPERRCNTRDGGHCQFALPGLADPALLGKLLQDPGTHAGGIRPLQRQPGI